MIDLSNALDPIDRALILAESCDAEDFLSARQHQHFVRTLAALKVAHIRLRQRASVYGPDLVNPPKYTPPRGSESVETVYLLLLAGYDRLVTVWQALFSRKGSKLHITLESYGPKLNQMLWVAEEAATRRAQGPLPAPKTHAVWALSRANRAAWDAKDTAHGLTAEQYLARPVHLRPPITNYGIREHIKRLADTDTASGLLDLCHAHWSRSFCADVWKRGGHPDFVEYTTAWLMPDSGPNLGSEQANMEAVLLLDVVPTYSPQLPPGKSYWEPR